MKAGIKKPRYIVADDFTGANDVGVALASSGIATQVLLAPDGSNGHLTSVGIICTNSRDLAPSEAKEKMVCLSSNYQLVENQPLLIKKVDSTLRGNIGSEIEALLEVGYALAIVAIAAPFAKRKTLDGLCYVNDIPLSDTEFASDPKSPIRSSRVTDIIKTQTNVKISEYLFSHHNSEPHQQHFSQLYDSGIKTIVCDAQTHDDLFDLYHAASQLTVPTIFVTTGELTYSLIEDIGAVQPQIETNNQPILAVIGSMSETTLAQAQFVIKNGIAQAVDLGLNELLAPDFENYLNRKALEASQILKNKNNCVIRSCRDPQLRYELNAIAEKHNQTQQQLAEHVRDCLAEIVKLIITISVPPKNISGLILCGGDIAIATAQKLGSPSYQLGGLVAGCVPWGTLDCELTPFPIFTKAGGFGDPTTFSQVIQYLHKEVK